MNHFVYSYHGNKRQEYKHFAEVADYTGIQNIIEPFCGSSAISFNIWLEHGDKFKYYLNDNDDMLMKVYQLIKDETADEIVRKVQEIRLSVRSVEEFNRISKNIDKNIYEHIFICKHSSFRAGQIHAREAEAYANGKHRAPYRFNTLKSKFIDFIKQPYVYISQDNWSTIFDRFSQDSTALIMLDPPYLCSCNQNYKKDITAVAISSDGGVYDYLTRNPINTFNSRIYMMLESVKIIEEMFGAFVLKRYDKKYEYLHRKKQHIIIGPEVRG